MNNSTVSSSPADTRTSHTTCRTVSRTRSHQKTPDSPRSVSNLFASVYSRLCSWAGSVRPHHLPKTLSRTNSTTSCQSQEGKHQLWFESKHPKHASVSSEDSLMIRCYSSSSSAITATSSCDEGVSSDEVSIDSASDLLLSSKTLTADDSPVPLHRLMTVSHGSAYADVKKRASTMYRGVQTFTENFPQFFDRMNVTASLNERDTTTYNSSCFPEQRSHSLGKKNLQDVCNTEETCLQDVLEKTCFLCASIYIALKF